MNATENKLAVLNNNNATTTYKIGITNGNSTISFELKSNIDSKYSAECANLLSASIISELQNLNDTNNNLKALGYKGKFFKFTAGKDCTLNIEKVIENESFSLVKKLEFNFGKLDKLENPQDVLNVILQGTLYTNQNNLQIC